MRDDLHSQTMDSVQRKYKYVKGKIELLVIPHDGMRNAG